MPDHSTTCCPPHLLRFSLSLSLLHPLPQAPPSLPLTLESLPQASLFPPYLLPPALSLSLLSLSTLSLYSLSLSELCTH